jgi:hypothetical protein
MTTEREPALNFYVPVELVRAWYSKRSGVKRVNFADSDAIKQAFLLWANSELPLSANACVGIQSIGEATITIRAWGSGSQFHALCRKLESALADG